MRMVSIHGSTMTLIMLIYLIHGISHSCISILRVNYIRVGTDSAFCHLCMTAAHEVIWLVSIKIAKCSLTQPSLQKEATATFKKCKAIPNVIRKQTNKAISLLPQQVGDINELIIMKQSDQKAENKGVRFLEFFRFLTEQRSVQREITMVKKLSAL